MERGPFFMTEQELINYPHDNRAAKAFANCLSRGIYDIPTIFQEIDKAYKTGKHRSPSHIRYSKLGIIKLASKNGIKLKD